MIDIAFTDDRGALQYAVVKEAIGTVLEANRERARWLQWRQDVASFICAHGYAADLIHVEEWTWKRSYQQGMTAAEAVAEVMALPLNRL